MRPTISRAMKCRAHHLPIIPCDATEFSKYPFGSFNPWYGVCFFGLDLNMERMRSRHGLPIRGDEGCHAAYDRDYTFNRRFGDGIS